MNTTSEKNILQSVTLATLQSMTREQLRLLAKRIGIKRGRNRVDTINNLLLAQSFGKKFSNGKSPKNLP